MKKVLGRQAGLARRPWPDTPKILLGQQGLHLHLPYSRAVLDPYLNDQQKV